MRVLVACESSGRVREAFRALGHDAWSNDLLPAEDGSNYHMQVDALVAMKEAEWDLMIAHPPCTYLCNSGVWALKVLDKEYYKDTDVVRRKAYVNKVNSRWFDMEDAREFFMTLWEANIPKIVIENPVPHKYAKLPPYTQTIQPYMFGDDASKRTCLWVKGLEPLSIPPKDQWVPPRIVNGLPRWSNQTDSGQNKLGPSETRASERSRTYHGIANAFAAQWGEAN